MVSSGSESVGVGRITQGIRSNVLIAKTLDFVRQQLPAWRDDPDRPDEHSEDKLNAQLCKFLDARARTDFAMVRFDHEEAQTGRRRVDLAASPAQPIAIGTRLHTIYDPLLVLEGKRLPPPSASREKEYVTGNKHKSGGIQRFKIGLHGAKVDIAAMIGYVQKRSPQHWHQVINEWISDLANDSQSDVCVWEAHEVLGRLEENTKKGIANCISLHDRTGEILSSKITLHHLWIVMNRSRS